MIKKYLKLYVVVMFSIIFFSACGKDDKGKIFLSEEKDSQFNDSETDLEINVQNEEPTEIQMIYVHLKGAVNSSGVYKVEKGIRIFEVINIAGGVSQDADTEAINMARPVSDEMVIYVPTKEEVSQGFSEESVHEYEDYKLDDDKSEGLQSDTSLININKATAEELMLLPGIGETKADLIIRYREENGDFASIEEIMNISGIKQAAFDKIKDKITI